MPGVAQLWLTEDDLLDVEQALYDTHREHTDAYSKVRAAREAVACPIPAKEDT